MLKSIVLLAAALPSVYAGGALTPTPKDLSASDWSGIRAEYDRHRQAAFPIEGGHRARNFSQQWVTRFDGRGFDVTPDAAGWRWGLELRSYGFPGQERSVQHARASADVEKLSYQWDSNMREWFVNGRGGLEHGFTLASRPGVSASALTLHLAVRGTLTPRVSSDGRWVSFLDERGAAALNYAGLKVTDAAGRELAARFTRESRGLLLEVEERGARYPITVDPIAQQAYLKPAAVGSTQAGDAFGRSVAVSGDTVVVGAPGEASSTTGVNSSPNESAGSSGAAYVFVRTAGVWSQQAYLKPAAVGSTQAGDQFGWSVTVSGDTVVVGANAEDSSTTGVNSSPNESGTNSGAAYVFTRTAGVWSQQAYLKPAAVGSTQVNDFFGVSVALSGDTLVVGAYGEDSSTTGVNSSPNESAGDAGAAYVFTRTAGVWSQQAYLKPAAVGTTQAGDQFGISVAVSGDTAVVGANAEDSSATGVNNTPNELAANAGAAYVFTRAAGVWSQQAYLKPAAVGTSQAQDNFGWSVAVSVDTVVVGAYGEASSSTGVNSSPNELAGSAGAAYVFTRTAGVWSQQAYLKPAAVGSSQASDQFGYSVAVSGDAIVVGANGEDSSTLGVNSAPDELASQAGAAYVFTRSAGAWSQQAYLKPAAVGTSQVNDNFGFSVAVSGDTAVVGALFEDSSSLGINSAADDSAGAVDSGAAYVYTVPLVREVRGVLRDTSGGIRLSTYASSTLINSGGAFASNPSAGEDLSGNVIAVARDNSNSIWANVFNAGSSTWGSWTFGAGAFKGDPALAVTPDGKAWVAAQDNSNSYWLNSYTPGIGWGSWTFLGGVFTINPAIASCADGSVYVIGKDSFNSVYSGRFIPGTGFQNFQGGGGAFSGSPSITCGSDNVVYMTARDSSNANWMGRVAGNTWGAYAFGGAVSSVDPKIAALGGGSLAIVTLGPSSSTYQNTFTEGTGNGWGTWTSLGGVFQDISPAALTGELYFAARTPGNDLYWFRTSSGFTGIGNTGVASGPWSVTPK